MPLSSQQRLLRTTLTVGLLGAARHNVDMGNHDVELFEVAHVYLPVAGSRCRDERWRLGGIVQGDFFRAKGIVEAIFEALHVEPTFERAQRARRLAVGARGAVGLGRAARPLDRPRRRVERVRARPRGAVRARARSGSSTAT